jgi:Cu(I)/Ag(I) efflux system membrane fusion protein
LGNGRFEPREVATGASLGEQVEILKGLKAGDDVVTRANFLVDSESRLRAALAQMASKPAQKP